jgi:DNA recombination protein RmuC
VGLRETDACNSSEVWQFLGAIKSEFDKYGNVVAALAKQLTTASNSVESLGRRTRAMSRKLKDVEFVSDQQSRDRLLGLPADEILNDGFEEPAALVEDAASEIIVRTSRPARANL